MAAPFGSLGAKVCGALAHLTGSGAGCPAVAASLADAPPGAVAAAAVGFATAGAAVAAGLGCPHRKRPREEAAQEEKGGGEEGREDAATVLLGRVDALQGELAAQKAELQRDLEEQKLNHDALRGVISTLRQQSATQAESLRATIARLEARLEGRMAALEGRASVQESRVTAAEGRIGAAERVAAALGDEARNTQQRLAAAEAEVAAVREEGQASKRQCLSELQDRASALDARATALEVQHAAAPAEVHEPTGLDVLIQQVLDQVCQEASARQMLAGRLAVLEDRIAGSTVVMLEE